MANILSDKLIGEINDNQTLKFVTAVDKTGLPHSAYKGSLHINEDGYIEFYDLLESSKINSNLVYAIWFNKKVTVNILTKDKQSYEIVGTPAQSITTGKRFEAVYTKLKHERNSDLNAIWLIKPEEVRNETFSVRKSEQEEKHPLLKHLDRVLKEDKK
jgi:hypothetical protein